MITYWNLKATMSNKITSTLVKKQQQQQQKSLGYAALNRREDKLR